MIEVSPRLFVGNQLDYEKHVKGKSGWFVVQACKEPYHREAVGYTGRGCDPKHPEYLFCYRDNRLVLNMVDAPKPEFFRDEMVNAATQFIARRLSESDTAKVLVHCNQGGSRALSLALLYLRRHDDRFGNIASFEEAEDVFRAAYPSYLPAAGIRAYVQQHWDYADDGRTQEDRSGPRS